MDIKCTDYRGRIHDGGIEMAVIKPFRAYRPKYGLEAEIVALPYDVYNREEATEAVQGKPLSFLKRFLLLQYAANYDIILNIVIITERI